MHNPRIVVRRTRSVVRAHALVVRLHGMIEQRASVERRSKSRGEIAYLCRVCGASCEGTGGAREDVPRRWLGERTDIREGQEVIDHCASHGSPLCLCVDVQALTGVFTPDLIDVALIVPVEEVVVHDTSRVWT